MHKHTLSFPQNLEIDPVISSLKKNPDDTWTIQLKVNGNLVLKSLESLDATPEKLHAMIDSGEIQIKLI